MRIFSNAMTLTMTLMMFSQSPVFSAFAADCKCDHECAEKCEKGEGHECACKECDCSKSGKCGKSCKHDSKTPAQKAATQNTAEEKK